MCVSGASVPVDVLWEGGGTNLLQVHVQGLNNNK